MSIDSLKSKRGKKTYHILMKVFRNPEEVAEKITEFLMMLNCPINPLLIRIRSIS
jgi:hypothetical protein